MAPPSQSRTSFSKAFQRAGTLSSPVICIRFACNTKAGKFPLTLARLSKLHRPIVDRVSCPLSRSRLCAAWDPHSYLEVAAAVKVAAAIDTGRAKQETFKCDSHPEHQKQDYSVKTRAS